MKRQNQLNIKRGLLSKLVLFVALFLGSSNAWGEDEPLTIYDSSTTNSYVPFSAGLYSVTGPKGQFIIPADMLSSIQGKKITKITFYGNSYTNRNFGNFSVYLNETDQTDFTSTSYVNWASMSSYYSGALTFSSDTKTMEIDLDFLYNGNNLLIGFVQTSTSSFASNSWYGESQTGDNYTALYTSNVGGAVAGTKFLPKMTITYETPAVPTLSISPVEDATFGNVTADATKSYTITNNSGETANVVPTITGTGAISFSVTDGAGVVINSGKDIASGATETFKVKFTYNPEDLNNEKTATITFTPNKDAEEAISINASATAILDAPIFELSYEGEKDAAFGEVTTNASKTYTVRNAGTQPMTVNISLSDASYYSLSSEDFTESTTSIEAGESKEFTVTFNYPSPLTIDELTERTATVTVTPTYNEELAETINASATVITDVVFDEEVTTTWPTGLGKNVYIKYTSKNGWNTICMPIPLSANIMNTLYGDGWKAYTISSYEENTLYFTKDNYLSTVARPYLVYGKANSPANGFVVEDIMVYNKEAVQDQAAESDAYFRGTYTKKEYNSETDELPANVWYGITNEGKVMKAGTGAYVNGFRAYFTGIEPASTNARVNIVLEDDGETTDLGFVRMVDPESKDVYTLSGQKVEKAGKGIYIVNGRKVVIK